MGGGWKEGCLSHLSELGLSISAKVFVAEAPGKLIVTSDTRRHQDLLVLLRALG